MGAALLAKTVWWKYLVLAFGAYLGICLLLFFSQRKLIYHPSKARYPLPPGFVEWHSPDGSQLWGFKRVRGTDQSLFFFHGNGGNASGWSHAVEEFPGDIYVLEYPGYGERPGLPSEKSIKAAALQAFEAEQGPYQQVIVAGQSLGTGVTEAIFTKYPEKISNLVLITPFLSLSEVARHYYRWLPTDLILRDRMELFEPWKAFPGKTCLILAGRDEIIPPSHGARFRNAKSDLCLIIELAEQGHNGIDLPRSLWEKVLSSQ